MLKNWSADEKSPWFALVIGNSRLHWAWFDRFTLQTWDTPHLSAESIATLIRHDFDFKRCPETAATAATINPPPVSQVPLWIASVVPAQTILWQAYSKAHLITLDQIPLQHLYPTLGIDRALALWGAANTLGLPALVIDAGTALTFTGADAERRLIGGAILPGLGLQLRSLTEHTATLPNVPLPHVTLPPIETQTLLSLPRWATNTVEAIASGIIYTLLAGLQDFVVAWRQQFPESVIVLTGGDSHILHQHWQHQHPAIASQIKVDPNLAFWGIRAIVAK